VITVAKLAPSDRPAWETLFRAYNSFYEEDHPQEMYDRAWREFQTDTRMHALGAWLDGTLTGFTHFLVHPRTTAADTCYLEDLFTVPEHRGKGVARALINAVADWAAAQGCSRVYWHTRETNATARLLYDKLATYSGFIMYSMDFPRPNTHSGT
jgi:GNAT superfamily N-acetyltransferase